MIAEIKCNSKPAEAGDRIIAKERQIHHKPLKAVTKPLFNLSLCVTTGVVLPTH
ncbi:MAG TPA: hypothetical protein PLW02_08435 [Verrucomicrobiota bacterium]|nr:hypothetical protein [Verrucomicrobiota bacterium]